MKSILAKTAYAIGSAIVAGGLIPIAMIAVIYDGSAKLLRLVELRSIYGGDVAAMQRSEYRRII